MQKIILLNLFREKLVAWFIVGIIVFEIAKIILIINFGSNWQGAFLN